MRLRHASFWRILALFQSAESWAAFQGLKPLAKHCSLLRSYFRPVTGGTCDFPPLLRSGTALNHGLPRALDKLVGIAASQLAHMHKGRLEAFTDGVIAIIITVMVLELQKPENASFEALSKVAPHLYGYLLSFVFLGIYWNNHHHMMQAVTKVNGAVLWANLHLLFWLSLIPFATQWMGAYFASIPVGVYGVLLLLCAIAYLILTKALIGANGKGSNFAKSLGKDFKGKISIVIYAIAVAVAWYVPYVSCALYVLVALMWLIPDRRFEHGSLGGSAPID